MKKVGKIFFFIVFLFIGLNIFAKILYNRVESQVESEYQQLNFSNKLREYKYASLRGCYLDWAPAATQDWRCSFHYKQYFGSNNDPNVESAKIHNKLISLGWENELFGKNAGKENSINDKRLPFESYKKKSLHRVFVEFFNKEAFNLSYVSDDIAEDLFKNYGDQYEYIYSIILDVDQIRFY